MDIITQLFNQIPESFRPYVAIVAILLYIVTKVRSEAKSMRIKSGGNDKGVVSFMLSTKDAFCPIQLKRPNLFVRAVHRVLDIFC